MYTKTLWKDRTVERPRTFEVVNNPDGTITLIPSEGTIIEPGTPILAASMNNIESGIEELFASKLTIAEAEPDISAGAIWFKIL